MAYIFVIFGTLIALNFGAISAASKGTTTPTAESGEVDIELIQNAPALTGDVDLVDLNSHE